ncbi:hypothetical protein, partial [Longimycelium tulufanense]|uniref:hypothetical protein n=1 Tax=Longimycelium tulufanense TaxID=907463 RepID=UPI001E65C226
VAGKLQPRLDGLADALVRAQAQAGGSYGELGLALDVPRSTAQHRRDTVTGREPTVWEDWATGALQERIQAAIPPKE